MRFLGLLRRPSLRYIFENRSLPLNRVPDSAQSRVKSTDLTTVDELVSYITEAQTVPYDLSEAEMDQVD